MEKQAAGTKRSADDTTRARRQRTQEARKQPGLRQVCRLRPPEGGEPRAKAAHNSPRQGAWAVVFVGVFVCVCVCLSAFLGWLVWVFGCFLGVFGVFSCFLIFLGCDGCGLFGFVLVCFGWGLLCLVLSVFVVLTRLLIL